MYQRGVARIANSASPGRYTQRLADNEQRSETYWPRVLAKLDKIAEEQAREKGTRGEQPEKVLMTPDALGWDPNPIE